MTGPWVPLERAQATADPLASVGSVTLEAYDEPEHVITDAAVERVRALVQRLP